MSILKSSINMYSKSQVACYKNTLGLIKDAKYSIKLSVLYVRLFLTGRTQIQICTLTNMFPELKMQIIGNIKYE